jgi:hypothetical protein
MRVAGLLGGARFHDKRQFAPSPIARLDLVQMKCVRAPTVWAAGVVAAREFDVQYFAQGDRAL